MTKPLALLFYSNLMPGSRLTNRLQELGYRVQTIGELGTLAQVAQAEKPLVALVEISCQPEPLAYITALRQNPETAHVPVLVYSAEQNKQLQPAAMKAGASLVASSVAILDQLPQLLDQVLEV